MRLLALCTLPRTNPGDRFHYVRANGPWRLTLATTGEAKLPYMGTCRGCCSRGPARKRSAEHPSGTPRGIAARNAGDPAPGGRAAGVQPDTWEHRSMTWQCRRCGRTVDLVLRAGDRCAACAMRTRAGRTLPDDDGAADFRKFTMRKLLQPSSSSAGDAGAQDAIGEAIHEAGGDLGDAAS